MERETHVDDGADTYQREPLRRRVPGDPYLYPILALALVLRIPGLSRSLWLDEAYSVMVRGSADLIPLLTMEGPHPPLYFLTLKLWMGALGSSEVAVRSLSMVFGVGSVAAIYLLGRELYDRPTGLLAAVLLAVSTLHVQLSQTARMYSLLTFFGVVSTLFYVRTVRLDADSARIGYIVTGVLLVYTHVYGWFVLLAHSLHLGIHAWRHRDLTRAVRRVKAQAVVGLFALPWLGFVLVPGYLLGSNSDTSWIPRPDLQVLRDIALAYVNVPTSYPQIALTDLTITVGYAALAVSAALIAALTVAEVRELGTLSGETGLLVLFVGTTVAVPYIVSVTAFPILIVRYGYLGFAGFAVLLSYAVTRLPGRWLRIGAVVVLLVLFTPGLGAYYQTSTMENWEGMADTLNEDDLSNDLVLYDPGYTEPPVAYYLSERSSREATTVRSGYLFRVESALREGAFAEVWVPTYEGTTGEVRRALSERYRRVDTRSFGSVSLVKYVRAGGGSGGSATGSGNASAATGRPTPTPVPSPRS